jgi:hypothetical protein
MRKLVSTEIASLWTGKSPSALRGLAFRGKITRYGSPRQAMFDLMELPPRERSNAEREMDEDAHGFGVIF